MKSQAFRMMLLNEQVESIYNVFNRNFHRNDFNKIEPYVFNDDVTVFFSCTDFNKARSAAVVRVAHPIPVGDVYDYVFHMLYNYNVPGKVTVSVIINKDEYVIDNDILKSIPMEISEKILDRLEDSIGYVTDALAENLTTLKEKVPAHV